MKSEIRSRNFVRFVLPESRKLPAIFTAEYGSTRKPTHSKEFFRVFRVFRGFPSFFGSGYAKLGFRPSDFAPLFLDPVGAALSWEGRKERGRP